MYNKKIMIVSALVLSLVMTISITTEAYDDSKPKLGSEFEPRNFHAGYDSIIKLSEEPSNMKLMDRKSTSFDNSNIIQYAFSDGMPNRYDANRR